MDKQLPFMTTDAVGLFNIDFQKGFIITAPSADFDAMMGKSTEGMNYLELVLPDDREAVEERLRHFCGGIVDFSRTPRLSTSFRHRVRFTDGRVDTVMFNAGREPGMTLRCSAVRLYDTFVGESVQVYKSNAVLESFAVSLAVLAITDYGHFIVKYANDDFYRMIGWNRMEFKDYFNEYLDDRIEPEDYALFAGNLLSLGPQHPECVFETRFMTMGDSAVVSEVRARFLTVEDGMPMVSVVFNDITERKRLRRELVVKNERYGIIQANTDQLIFDYDTEQDICVISGNLQNAQKILSLYGIKCVNNEFAIEKFFDSQFALGMMSKKHYAYLEETFANTILHGTGGEIEFLFCFIGQPAGLWHKAVFSAVKDENGDVVRIVGRLKNIDKQKRAEALMERRICSDMLTGLLNKDTVLQRIQSFLETEEANWQEDEKYHALLIIDLDNFHMVNEFFGHTFGDDVIREFASDIKSSFRDTDIIGRIGGDEFIVLMKNVTLKFATKKAGKLCRSLIKHYGIQNKITLTCSIGLAFFGKDSMDFDTLYRYTDWAVYNAKQNGRSTYCLFDSQAHDDYRRLEALNSRTCMDPPSSSSEISELDVNLLDIAFSLATSSDDIYGTLEILLRTVGRKYNLSAVSVLVKRYDQPERLRAVDRWVSIRNNDRDGNSPMVTETINLDPLFRAASLKCVSDISASSLPAGIKSKLKNDGIYAFVWGKLEGRAGVPFGYMMFTQFNRTRKWSRKELNTFKYLSKIVSVALIKAYTDRTLLFRKLPDRQPMPADASEESTAAAVTDE